MSVYEQVIWSIAHDSCREGDRAPLGAAKAGSSVTLRLRVDESVRHLVRSAQLVVGEQVRTGGAWRRIDMAACAEGFTVAVGLDARLHVAFYVFRVELVDGEIAWYVPRVDGAATTGELVRDGVDGSWDDETGWTWSDYYLGSRPTDGFALGEMVPGFQITVYDPGFETPEWLAGSIMYQIFPDRFARGEQGCREKGFAYHRKMGRPFRLHKDWNEAPDWLGVPTPDASDGEADSLEAAMAAYDPVDFFGGTLEGIREKLPYLASLGVEVLYLNPLFEARSNHRYDTADYEHVEPILGSDDDFSRLAEEARQQGISILLDAVLSHTGDDSRYFNERGSYSQPGAMQGEASPFRQWFDFTPQENGVPYRCWWGDKTLPEVDEHNVSWQHYMFGVPGGVDEPVGILPKWLVAGARGYRLDVADEIPDDVLARIRSCAKAARPDAAIIGEVWEDATTKVSYGRLRDYALGPSLDSVMNYPLRSALIGFALGAIDARQLATFLKLQQANYAPPFYRCLMNLLSSHDVERLRSVLALGGPVKNLPRDEQVELVSEIAEAQDVRAARLQRAIVALLYALPGVPCIYYGDERGLQGGGDPFCRATFPWDDDARAGRGDCGEDLTEFYRSIGMVRKGSPALRTGMLVCEAPDADVVVAVRLSEGEGFAVAACNRAGEPRVVACDLRSALGGFSGRLELAFSSEADADEACATFEDGIVRVAAPACSTVLFTL